MVQLCEQYRKGGYRAARYEPAAFILQGERAAVVDVAWHVDRAPGDEPWRFHTTYNLVRAEAGWRVLLCTAYEEKPLAG